MDAMTATTPNAPLLALVALRSVRGVGQRALSGCTPTLRNGVVEAVLEGDEQAVVKLGLPVKAQAMWLDEKRRTEALEAALRELERAAQLGVRILTPLDDEYPVGLARIPDPPPLLYVRGPLPRRKAIAAVGTRQPTADGVYMLRRAVAEVAARGWTIVSGLAEGLDTAAHQTALDLGAPTTAVLAHGLRDDLVYPPQNRELAARILDAGGTLVSERALDARPDRGAFVSRNRIQTGLSVAVVVGEAAETSGTMHTAKAAHAQGRLVFCWKPRQANLERHSGLQKLLAEGAALPLVTASDLVAGLPGLYLRYQEIYDEPCTAVTEQEERTAQDTVLRYENKLLRAQSTEDRVRITELEGRVAQLEAQLGRARAAVTHALDAAGAAKNALEAPAAPTRATS